MLDTFIKNKGITKTIIHDKNKNYYNEIHWDADYDGENANLSLNIDNNGNKEYMKMKMNNDELAELLNIPSQNNMLDKRLYNDFLSDRPTNEYKIIEIPKSILPKDSYNKNKKKVHFKNDMGDMDDVGNMSDINDITNQLYTHISSPTSQEELIFPLTLNEPKTRKHRVRHHKKPHTHVTYKVHRKNKGSRSSSSSSSSSPSSRKTLRKHKHRGYSRRTF